MEKSYQIHLNNSCYKVGGKLVENRKFKMWYYTVSHGQLLLRSVGKDKNVDIYFGDLRYLEIPCTLDGIKIISPEQKDIDYLSKKVNLDNLTVTVLLCSDKRYYVVSGIVKVMENNLDMFELPFDT